MLNECPTFICFYGGVFTSASMFWTTKLYMESGDMMFSNLNSSLHELPSFVARTVSDDMNRKSADLYSVLEVNFTNSSHFVNHWLDTGSTF